MEQTDKTFTESKCARIGNPYFPIFYAVFETMIGPINPNPYIHWLNKKILKEVYSEPSETSAEAATRGALWEKVFLEISQNSQENTCARVSFLIKLQAHTCKFIKKETLAQSHNN